MTYICCWPVDDGDDDEETEATGSVFCALLATATATGEPTTPVMTTSSPGVVDDCIVNCTVEPGGGGGALDEESEPADAVLESVADIAEDAGADPAGAGSGPAGATEAEGSCDMSTLVVLRVPETKSKCSGAQTGTE